MRYRSIWLIVLVALVGCGAPTIESTAPSTATPPIATTVAVLAPTPVSTALPTPAPTAIPVPIDVPATLNFTPSVTITLKTAPVGAELATALRQLPADVLLAETAPTDRLELDINQRRRLVLMDTRGQEIAALSDDLERLGWCSSLRDEQSPGGTWSDDGLFLLVSCQSAFGIRSELAVLDVAAGTWHGFDLSQRPMFYDGVLEMNRPSGMDEISAYDWLVAGQSIVFSHRTFTYDVRGEQTNETTSVWAWSLPDQTLTRIADFDGVQNYNYTKIVVASDQRHVAVVGGRANDVHAALYIWSGGATLRRMPLDAVANFRGIAAIHHWQSDSNIIWLSRSLNPASETYVLQDVALDLITNEITVLREFNDGHVSERIIVAPDGKHYAQGFGTGWNIYNRDHTLRSTFAVALPDLAVNAAWSADSQSLFVGRVVQDVGAELGAVDVDGGSTIVATYPNVGFAYPGVAQSADGLLAVSLSNPLVVILDAQRAEISSFPGFLKSWRP